jgi:transcriptional regulator with PAS, ATPase and Fis domain
MNEVREFLRSASKYREATVLLQGETGTGKEVAARYLHQLTFGESASTMPFVAVNCAAVPPDLFEAELFGSERGAYTGADRRREGLFEAAGEGTLFLDEIGETPMALQAKLLRVLEAREYRPLGSVANRAFHGRIITATNRPLRDMVMAGRFRMDLLYRLDVMSCELPPLRAHMDDLPAIAESILNQLSLRFGRPKPLLRTAELECLRRYPFPGNVRELRNLLERSLLRSSPGSSWLVLDLAWLGANQMQTPGLESYIQVPPNLSPIEAEEFALLAKTLRAERGGIRRAALKIGISHQSLLRRLERWPELRKAAGMV